MDRHSHKVWVPFSPYYKRVTQLDRCTPEGKFGIRDLYPHKSWNYFIWIDYPTEDSWKKHREAKAAGLIPQDATIGGEIGIHGVPEGYDYAIDHKMNWTWGCISMKNADVAELYEWARKGMSVVIEP